MAANNKKFGGRRHDDDDDGFADDDGDDDDDDDKEFGRWDGFVNDGGLNATTFRLLVVVVQSDRTYSSEKETNLNT